MNGYTDDFLDPVKGRSVALSQIAKGSRVVFQVASACVRAASQDGSSAGTAEATEDRAEPAGAPEAGTGPPDTGSGDRPESQPDARRD